MSWQTTADRLAGMAMTALGNAVTIGGVSGYGILQSPAESILDGVVIVTDYMLELPRTVWPVVPEGTAITVDGLVYVAREQSRPNVDRSSIYVPLELARGNNLLTLAGDVLTTQNGLQLVAI